MRPESRPAWRVEAGAPPTPLSSRAPLRRSLLTSHLVRKLVPILILVIGALAFYVDFFPGAKFAVLSNIDAGLGQTPQTKLGLDLQGGFEIKYDTVDAKVLLSVLAKVKGGDFTAPRVCSSMIHCILMVQEFIQRV